MASTKEPDDIANSFNGDDDESVVLLDGVPDRKWSTKTDAESERNTLGRKESRLLAKTRLWQRARARCRLIG